MTYIITEQLPPRFAWDPDRPVRGTEKFYTYTARHWPEPVTLVGNFSNQPDDTDQIRYLDHAELDPMDIGSEEAVLLCNPRSRRRDLSSRVTVWSNLHLPTQMQYSWLHECVAGLSNKLVVISNTQAADYRAACRAVGIRPTVISHGVDPEVYFDPGLVDDGLEPRPRSKVVCYTSSPDRGLRTLQRIWNDYDLTKQGWSLMHFDYDHGSVPDHVVALWLRRCMFWAHPGEGSEYFCLSAAEAQSCGATPIVVPNMALAETVRYGYRFTPQSYAEGLCAVLAGEATIEGINRQSAGILTWAEATDQLASVVL